MGFWRFGWNSDLGPALGGSYNPLLVLLSIGAACLAAYTALAVVDRMVVARRPGTRTAWLVGGAGAMGSGIWAMHFIAMLAFSLPTAMTYKLWVTLFSVVPALAGSAIALHVMARDTIGLPRLQLGGLLMAVGIGTMHYTGMEAVRAQALMRYDATLFVLSIVVAHVLATGALYTRFLLRRSVGNASWVRLGAAVLMGNAVTGMHYTAMAAVRFFPAPVPQEETMTLPPVMLSVGIIVAVLLIGGLAILGTIIDRQLTRAADSVRESEAFSKSILDAIGEGIYGLALDGLVTFINPAGAKMLGYTPDEVVGRPGTMFLAPIHHPHRMRRDNEHGSDEVHSLSREGEGRLVWGYDLLARKDGSTFRVQYCRTPLNREGVMTGTVVAFQDITEFEDLQRKLGHAQKLESIGQLAAGVAHEINTPTQYVRDNTRFVQATLEKLVGFLETCETCLQEDQQKENARDIVEELARSVSTIDLAYIRGELPAALHESLEGLESIARIVQALREFSHPGARTRRPLDVNHIVETTLTVSRNEWKYVAEIESQLGPSLPPVDAFPGELNQALVNIIINAAHAITTRFGDQCGKCGRIRIITGHDRDGLLITISDNGCGMTPDIVDRIFDPFFTTKEVGRGTGQGLSIVHAVVVQKHNGSITVQSEPGEGTTFRIRLPASEARRPVEPALMEG
jgi:two-component system, NtrC family, sensor kinase